MQGPDGGHASVQARRSLSYQATLAISLHRRSRTAPSHTIGEEFLGIASASRTSSSGVVTIAGAGSIAGSLRPYREVIARSDRFRRRS